MTKPFDVPEPRYKLAITQIHRSTGTIHFKATSHVQSQILRAKVGVLRDVMGLWQLQVDPLMDFDEVLAWMASLVSPEELSMDPDSRPSPAPSSPLPPPPLRSRPVIGGAAYLHLYPETVKEAQAALRAAHWEWIYGVQHYALTPEDYRKVAQVFGVGYAVKDEGFYYVARDALRESEASRLILQQQCR